MRDELLSSESGLGLSRGDERVKTWDSTLCRTPIIGQIHQSFKAIGLRRLLGSRPLPARRYGEKERHTVLNFRSYCS
jgi:hypothetical protein